MPLICPQCRTPLRVADSSRLEKPFECPECSLLLVYDADSQNVMLSDGIVEKPIATKVEESTKPVLQESFEEKLKSIQKPGLLSKGIESFNRLLKSPLAFVWIMASVFLLLFIVLVIVPIFSQREIELKKLRAELDRTIKEETPLAPEKKPEPIIIPKETASDSSYEKNVNDMAAKTKGPKTENLTPKKSPKPEPEKNKPEKKTPAKPLLPDKPKTADKKKEPATPKRPKYSLPKNLNERFAQKIVRFEQKDPVSLQELLVEMEVLLDVKIEPLVGESPISKKLQKTDIQIDLKNTTVKEIFTALLKKADLTYKIGKDRIYLEELK